jgi:hypothetical protein
MSPIGDSINPKDDIQTRLSRAPAPEELPAALLCRRRCCVPAATARIGMS